MLETKAHEFTLHQLIVFLYWYSNRFLTGITYILIGGASIILEDKSPLRYNALFLGRYAQNVWRNMSAKLHDITFSSS